MCSGCNERKSSGGLDVSVDDLKRSRSPLGPHRSKLVIICLTFLLLLDLWWSGWKGTRGRKGVRRFTYTISRVNRSVLTQLKLVVWFVAA